MEHARARVRVISENAEVPHLPRPLPLNRHNTMSSFIQPAAPPAEARPRRQRIIPSFTSPVHRPVSRYSNGGGGGGGGGELAVGGEARARREQDDGDGEAAVAMGYLRGEIQRLESSGAFSEGPPSITPPAKALSPAAAGPPPANTQRHQRQPPPAHMQHHQQQPLLPPADLPQGPPLPPTVPGRPRVPLGYMTRYGPSAMPLATAEMPPMREIGGRPILHFGPMSASRDFYLEMGQYHLDYLHKIVAHATLHESDDVAKGTQALIWARPSTQLLS